MEFSSILQRFRHNFPCPSVEHFALVDIPPAIHTSAEGHRAEKCPRECSEECFWPSGCAQNVLQCFRALSSAHENSKSTDWNTFQALRARWPKALGALETPCFFEALAPTLFKFFVGGKKPILKRRAPKGSPESCGAFGVLQEGSAEHCT